MQQELLRLPAVLARVGWGRSTLYMKVKNGEFPSPIALGSRARAWVSSEIDAWIQQKIEQARDDAKPVAREQTRGDAKRKASAVRGVGG